MLERPYVSKFIDKRIVGVQRKYVIGPWVANDSRARERHKLASIGFHHLGIAGSQRYLHRTLDASGIEKDSGLDVHASIPATHNARKSYACQTALCKPEWARKMQERFSPCLRLESVDTSALLTGT
jgi:hypothetical protein